MFAHKHILAYFLVFTFMSVVAIVSYQSTSSLIATGEKVSHIYDVVGKMHLIEKLLDGRQGKPELRDHYRYTNPQRGERVWLSKEALDQVGVGYLDEIAKGAAKVLAGRSFYYRSRR